MSAAKLQAREGIAFSFGLWLGECLSEARRAKYG
jgi:hypothetical protein